MYKTGNVVMRGPRVKQVIFVIQENFLDCGFKNFRCFCFDKVFSNFVDAYINLP